MRTTLSLDPDVVALLETVRARATRYHTDAVDLGRCLIGDIDDTSEVLAAGEGEAFQ